MNLFLLKTVFLTVSLALFAPLTALAAASTTITADRMDYFTADDRYVATGNVRIAQEDAVITCDTAVYNGTTSEAELSGNVVYDDKSVSFRAKKAEMNLDRQTGTLHAAVILFKKDNYWFTGTGMRKLGPDNYYAEKATFTTCNTTPYLDPKEFLRTPLAPDLIGVGDSVEVSGIDPPDWCFRAREVNITVGDRLTARNVTYSIKGLSVLYSPYLHAPVGTERRSGFLFPLIGSSSRKGFNFSPSFFWAIDDHMDATFYVDYYSKRGFGEGIDFRYANELGVNLWQGYHIRDTLYKKDYYDIRVKHRDQLGALQGYIDINYINDENFYKEYLASNDIRSRRFGSQPGINRFFQSSAEVFMPAGQSRIYLLGQNWVDLATNNDATPHKLPEIGYVLNPRQLGPFSVALSSSYANFHREQGVQGQRLDLNPSLVFSVGDSVRLTQSLSLRETIYALERNPSGDDRINRENLEYKAFAQSRFFKRYDSFAHVVEPSIEYLFIPTTEQVPAFDSLDMITKTSRVSAALLNVFYFPTLSVAARISQPYDLNPSEQKDNLMPTRFEASVTGRPLTLKFDLSQDFRNNRTERAITQIGYRFSDTTSLTIGEVHDRLNDITFFTAGFTTPLSQRIMMNASVWYDAKGGGLRDALLKTTYREQCWAIHASLVRRPGDTVRPSEVSLTILFELKGLGRIGTLSL